MTTSTTTITDRVLTQEMLARFDERAATYDRQNRFFQEDFDELRQSGYLGITIPEKFGGPGLPLVDVLELQRRLAYVAPATALGANMHFFWTGLAADLHRAGEPTCDWILERTAAGDVFAAGHGEAGNDVPLFYSSARAERVEGGWQITGHKIFGSLSPVWSFLGVHAMDTSDPAEPRVVHAGASIPPTRCSSTRSSEAAGYQISRGIWAEQRVARNGEPRSIRRR